MDVDPVPRNAELIETFEYLCMATVGVVVGVNQIIGGTHDANRISVLVGRFIQLPNQAAADSYNAASTRPDCLEAAFGAVAAVLLKIADVSESRATTKNKNGRIFRSGRNAKLYSAKPTPRDAT
ncbi:hypothetical protein QA645_41740 [Bradyrhizobium sp. CIAT3101]|uniref:hypothetical protein n=1 Tax=Bradyrhizobium sp. CIAT3101 TaxID=439387 RepID=UPI0024B20119|nr:hypothetical protein [Bradyrhizobium sp. CIAT3101]WFU80865.1 hypothetical protein QA645_41740 [Bradyrhizobium sp. CIAT3101]